MLDEICVLEVCVCLLCFLNGMVQAREKTEWMDRMADESLQWLDGQIDGRTGQTQYGAPYMTMQNAPGPPNDGNDLSAGCACAFVI